ncbi:MAG: PaaI family thioesterase [Firmicutes bacterium]|nr:PaaI family thioesterase [Bacillota bacterium]
MEKDINQINMENEVRAIVSSHFNDEENLLLNMLNPKFVECNYEEKSITVKYKAEKWNMNTGGTMHGGIICTAFDNCFGILAHSLCRTWVTTIDINVRFLKPVFCGEELIVTAKADMKGNTIISLSGEAKVGDKLVAGGCATFMNIGGKNNG